MNKFVWFARSGEQLYVAITPPGGSPVGKAKPCSSVTNVYKWLRKQEHKAVSVGIVPPETLGLE